MACGVVVVTIFFIADVANSSERDGRPGIDVVVRFDAGVIIVATGPLGVLGGAIVRSVTGTSCSK